MKKLLLLIIVATLMSATAAAACQTTTALEAVKAVAKCSSRVAALTPELPDLPDIVELAPIDIDEIVAFAINAKTKALEMTEATVIVESQERVKEDSRVGVVLTVVKALGKALLKAIATLLHEAV